MPDKCNKESIPNTPKSKRIPYPYRMNFMALMFSGLLLMGMLTETIIRQNPAASGLTDAAYADTADGAVLVPAPVILEKPARMESDALLEQMLPDVPAAASRPSTTRLDPSARTARVPDASAPDTPDTTTTAQGNPYIIEQDYRSPYYIVVYTGSQSTAVYGKDDAGEYTRLIKAFTCSTGREDTSPTRRGMYRIRAKYRWRLLKGNCYGQYSSSISRNYLFHSVPYDRQTPSALYNASYDCLGRAVSHGCIRLCVRDCKWIYDNCPIGTQVHVVWESGPKGDAVPPRIRRRAYSGWDPSDQWSEGNPYFAQNVASQ